MPQGRIARSWFRERNEAKSRLISPYILRGSPFFSRFKTQTRQNTEQKRLIQTREAMAAASPWLLWGARTEYTILEREGGRRGRGRRKTNWLESTIWGILLLQRPVWERPRQQGPWEPERDLWLLLSESRQAGAAIHLSSRGISVLRMAGSASPHCHPKKGKIFQTENASCVQQKTRNHQVKTQTRLSPRAACRFSTSLRVFNDLVGTTLVSYLACSNGFLIIISRLVLKISGKG